MPGHFSLDRVTYSFHGKLQEDGDGGGSCGGVRDRGDKDGNIEEQKPPGRMRTPDADLTRDSID